MNAIFGSVPHSWGRWTIIVGPYFVSGVQRDTRDLHGVVGGGDVFFVCYFLELHYLVLQPPVQDHQPDATHHVAELKPVLDNGEAAERHR